MTLRDRLAVREDSVVLVPHGDGVDTVAPCDPVAKLNSGSCPLCTPPPTDPSAVLGRRSWEWTLLAYCHQPVVHTVSHLAKFMLRLESQAEAGDLGPLQRRWRRRRLWQPASERAQQRSASLGARQVGGSRVLANRAEERRGGDHSLLLGASSTAPFWSRTSITSVKPWNAAQCSAVFPLLAV